MSQSTMSRPKFVLVLAGIGLVATIVIVAMRRDPSSVPLTPDGMPAGHSSSSESVDKLPKGGLPSPKVADEPIETKPLPSADALPRMDPSAVHFPAGPPPEPTIYRFGSIDDGKTPRQALAAEISRWLDGELSPVAVEGYLTSDAAEVYVREALTDLKNVHSDLATVELLAYQVAVEDKKAKGAVEVYTGILVENEKGEKYFQWPKGSADPNANNQMVTSWIEGKELKVIRMMPGEYPQYEKARAECEKVRADYPNLIRGFLQDAARQ